MTHDIHLKTSTMHMTDYDGNSVSTAGRSDLQGQSWASARLVRQFRAEGRAPPSDAVLVRLARATPTPFPEWRWTGPSCKQVPHFACPQLLPYTGPSPRPRRVGKACSCGMRARAQPLRFFRVSGGHGGSLHALLRFAKGPAGTFKNNPAKDWGSTPQG